ncbi:hypothetical protein KDX04_02525 [Burkholderia cenocepacia]|uniref:hypothetical protein n=1 Tax=Burkholderia cenocepacia TaxID=95486 RepID=UPI00163A01C4|nr:hypothetical protein [Burkholderia cenocepacia]MBR7984684.1 hypothetical protein [Burkholderia cenocepacia]MBR8507195.1 hypothetical protein [Burkholderia cenocepacia]
MSQQPDQALRLVDGDGQVPNETFRNTVDLIKFSFRVDKRLSDFLSADGMLSWKVVSMRDTSSCIEAMRVAGLC